MVMLLTHRRILVVNRLLQHLDRIAAHQILIGEFLGQFYHFASVDAGLLDRKAEAESHW